MKVHVEEYADFGRSVRRMVTAMIVNDEACRQLCQIYDPTLMPDLKEISKIIDWVITYWKETDRCPGKVIQDIYDARCADLDEIDKESILKFLTTLNNEYTSIASDDFTFVIHESKKFIMAESRKALMDELKEADEENFDEILQELQSICVNQISSDGGETHDPFDPERINKVLDGESMEPLFTLPGALGELINPTLIRGGFISFQGEEKIGKSWWLLYLMIRALRKRLRVVFFQAGDMSADDFDARHVSMHTGTATMEANAGEFDNVAVKVEDGVDYVSEKIRMTTNKDVKKMYATLKRIGRNRIKVVTYSNGTLNAGMMKRKLKQFRDYEDFICDVGILDYADIMKAEDGTNHLEGRDKINKNWMALRSVSQEEKMLLITASQGNKDSRDKLQNKKSGTEDKRKDSHITAGFGLSSHNMYKEKVMNGDCIQINMLYSRNTAQDNRLVLLQRELRKGQVCVASTFVPWPQRKKE